MKVALQIYCFLVFIQLSYGLGFGAHAGHNDNNGNGVGTGVGICIGLDGCIEDDPASWSKKYPLCGSGKQQSPIYIQNVTNFSPCTSLGYVNFDVNFTSVKIKNDGYTVILKLAENETKIPSIYGSVLLRNYTFREMTFHWGESDDVQGTENIYSQTPRVMEIEMFFTYDGYGDKYDKYDDGMVMLSYIYYISKRQNAGIQSVVENLKHIEKAGESHVISQFPNLKVFIPFFDKMYVTYIGSLTSPPCTEHVRWLYNFVAMETTSEQVAEFRKLKNSQGKPIKRNTRPTQPINNRFVGVNTNYN